MKELCCLPPEASQGQLKSFNLPYGDKTYSIKQPAAADTFIWVNAEVTNGRKDSMQFPLVNGQIDWAGGRWGKDIPVEVQVKMNEFLAR